MNKKGFVQQTAVRKQFYLRDKNDFDKKVFSYY